MQKQPGPALLTSAPPALSRYWVVNCLLLPTARLQCALRNRSPQKNRPFVALSLSPHQSPPPPLLNTAFTIANQPARSQYRLLALRKLGSIFYHHTLFPCTVGLVQSLALPRIPVPGFLQVRFLSRPCDRDRTRPTWPILLQTTFLWSTATSRP